MRALFVVLTASCFAVQAQVPSQLSSLFAGDAPPAARTSRTSGAAALKAAESRSALEGGVANLALPGSPAPAPAVAPVTQTVKTEASLIPVTASELASLAGYAPLPAPLPAPAAPAAPAPAPGLAPTYFPTPAPGPAPAAAPVPWSIQPSPPLRPVLPIGDVVLPDSDGLF
jgi:hypothetical protein